MICIQLVGMKKSEILPGEAHALCEALKDVGAGEIEYVETPRPQNAQEHVAECRRIKPLAVLLPYSFDRSIASVALRHGFRHIVISAGVVSEYRQDRVPELQEFKA